MIASGCLPPQSVLHSPETLARIAELAKPGAKVTIAQAVKSSGDGSYDAKLVNREQLVKNIKLAGLVNVQQPVALEGSLKEEIR